MAGGRRGSGFRSASCARTAPEGRPYGASASGRGVSGLPVDGYGGVEGAGRVPVRPRVEHDSPKLLFRLACEYLTSSRIVRPGVVTVLEHVATARARAKQVLLPAVENVALAPS